MFFASIHFPTFRLIDFSVFCSGSVSSDDDVVIFIYDNGCRKCSLGFFRGANRKTHNRDDVSDLAAMGGGSVQIANL